MTRSVEIPEAAVDYLGRLWWKQYDTESPYQHAQSVAKTREAIEGLLPYLAPVGDGGLREALEQHAEVWSTTGGPLGVSYATRVRDLVAARPAAPAVPQPVDREALRDLLSDFVDSDDCWYDHHGYCQAHGWFRTDPACPHARAKAVLAGEQVEP